MQFKGANQVKKFHRTKATAVLFGNEWVRLCETVNTKGNLVPYSHITDPKKLKEYLAKAPESDWYRSLFYFGPDGKKYFDKNGGMGGYKGSAYTKSLIFDFDSKNVDDARKDSITLLERLIELDIDVVSSCRIFFSGQKGFHVELLTGREFTPKEIKPICSNLANGLKSFDPKVYNETRLFRLVNTKHQKSGLYKIELHPDDLLNKEMDLIKEQATKPSSGKDRTLKAINADQLDRLLALYEKTEVKKDTRSVVVDSTEDDNGIRGLDKIDFNNIPKGMPRCIYALSHGVMRAGAGERNDLFLRLAAYYRNQGMAQKVCLSTLVGVAEMNAELYPEEDKYTEDELKHTVVASAYSENFKVIPGNPGFSAEDELLKMYCDACEPYTDKACIVHGSKKKKNNSNKSVQIDDVFDSFNNFAKNFDKNSVKTGIDFMDTNMNIAVGTTTLLVGASGSGKTTLGLNIMENANALDQHTMFFSLDMHKNLVYLKLAKKITNYTQDELIAMFQRGDQKKLMEIKEAISAKYGKTYFNFSSTLSMDQIFSLIWSIESVLLNLF